MTASAPLAAILYTPEDRIEALMFEAAHVLAQRGVKLGGILQHDVGMAPDDTSAMELENVANGERFALSQTLGSGAEACTLDTASLAHAAALVRNAVEDGAHLICVNKFGAQEALGNGLREEIGMAVASGVPVLTAVATRFLPDWERFSDGYGELLAPELDAILAWWARTSVAR